MVAELIAFTVAVLAAIAECIHLVRCRRIAALAYGPGQRPAPWVATVPFLRIAALTAISWGLATLTIVPPKVHQAAEVEVDEYKHVVMVLDVSPSMRLDDAGPEKDTSRTARARELLDSFFLRVPMEEYRVTVIATYTDAKPVVIDTRDIEVVRNIISDLPMHHAFVSGKTKLFAGLEAAAEIARPWNPRSTTLLLVSDGDTVPAQGMPKMPASVSSTLVVGVGDARVGKFIDGRQSRQDTSTLRQIATRLGGSYHNGNEKHIPTETLNMLAKASASAPLEKLTRREYAMIAAGAGASTYAVLPFLLHFAGTFWRPGVRHSKTAARRSSPSLV
ncbi:MAG: VWA domain-containing protein [Planctomycetales bacterium]|nr:VWA domain-containing protein [Planctomycetales bacterium]